MRGLSGSFPAAFSISLMSQSGRLLPAAETLAAHRLVSTLSGLSSA